MGSIWQSGAGPVKSASKLLRFALTVPSLSAACHAAHGGSGPDTVGPASDVGSAVSATTDAVALPTDDARPQVQLTWRLFETLRWMDRSGEERESSIFELMIEGGTPSRVQLGRRESLGCVVRDATDGLPHLAQLECYSSARGEFANVTRPRAGELHIEAFGQDEAHPSQEPRRTNVQTATVRIPSEADIVVDRELARIPGDAPQRPPSSSMPPLIAPPVRPRF